MAQRFLAPEVTFEGLIKQNGTVSNDSHVITRGYLHGNVINGIHPDSANYAEVIADNGVNKLKLKPLTVTDVTVNSSATSLSDFANNVYDGSNFQEGDIVFLTSMTPTECYIHNGGSAGNSNDWELVNSGLSQAQVRAMLSASSGVNYNSSTGEFTADQAEIQAFFSAGTGLSYSAGQFALNATSDQISEGSSNLFFTDARAQGAISVASLGATDVQLLDYSNGVLSVALSDIFSQFSAGSGLAWDGGGEFSLNADSDDISEGVNNLFYTDARVYASLSAGVGLQFSNGEFALNADSDDISEGTSNLFYTDARAQSAISVSGAGLSYSSGVFTLTADSDDISEGTTNLYHTTARARTSIQADPSSKNLLTYMNQSGDIMVSIDKFRKDFQNQSLTANTGLQLTHNLGKQLVDVIAMDSQGEKIDLKVVYTSSTVVTVTSTVGLTGIDIAVRI